MSRTKGTAFSESKMGRDLPRCILVAILEEGKWVGQRGTAFTESRGEEIYQGL